MGTYLYIDQGKERSWNITQREIYPDSSWITQHLWVSLFFLVIYFLLLPVTFCFAFLLTIFSHFFPRWSCRLILLRCTNVFHFLFIVSEAVKYRSIFCLARSQICPISVWGRKGKMMQNYAKSHQIGYIILCACISVMY